MGYQIEGTDAIGFRVVDDEAGPLTGRMPSVEQAMERAGVAKPKAQPRSKNTDD